MNTQPTQEQFEKLASYCEKANDLGFIAGTKLASHPDATVKARFDHFQVYREKKASQREEMWRAILGQAQA
jgi:hypothetical protein